MGVRFSIAMQQRIAMLSRRSKWQYPMSWEMGWVGWGFVNDIFYCAHLILRDFHKNLQLFLFITLFVSIMEIIVSLLVFHDGQKKVVSMLTTESREETHKH